MHACTSLLRMMSLVAGVKVWLAGVLFGASVYRRGLSVRGTGEGTRGLVRMAGDVVIIGDYWWQRESER